MRVMWALLRATVSDWYQDRAQRMGVALAYDSAQILLFGAEFTKVWTKQRRSGFWPEETAVSAREEARKKRGLGPLR
jgi:hypothetical protein